MEPESHADNSLTAFGAMNRNKGYMPEMDALCASDRAEIKQGIGRMVDTWVDMASVWEDLGGLVNLPVYNTSASRWNCFP